MTIRDDATVPPVGIRFPGLEAMAGNRQAEPVIALLNDGTEQTGELAGFSASAETLQVKSGGEERSLAFADLQWLTLTRPIDPSASAEAFRAHGIEVQTLPQRSP